MTLLEVVATTAQRRYNTAVDMQTEKQGTLILLIFVKFVKVIIMQHLMEVS